MIDRKLFNQVCTVNSGFNEDTCDEFHDNMKKESKNAEPVESLSDEELSDVSSDFLKELALYHAVCNNDANKVKLSDKSKALKIAQACHQNTAEEIPAKQESLVSQGMSKQLARKIIHTNKVEELGDEILDEKDVGEKHHKIFKSANRSFKTKKSASLQAAREVCITEAKATSKLRKPLFGMKFS